MDDYGAQTGKRNLTEADVEAIVNSLEKQMVNRFYTNLGKGVWAAVWAVIVAAALALAVLGARLNSNQLGS
jgi:hypothetical protein